MQHKSVPESLQVKLSEWRGHLLLRRKRIPTKDTLDSHSNYERSAEVKVIVMHSEERKSEGMRTKWNVKSGNENENQRTKRKDSEEDIDHRHEQVDAQTARIEYSMSPRI